jgi:hypothetical protein
MQKYERTKSEGILGLSQALLRSVCLDQMDEIFPSPLHAPPSNWISIQWSIHSPAIDPMALVAPPPLFSTLSFQ